MHWDANIQWAAHLVDDLFQLGQAIEQSKADFVVDGQPKHYARLVPVTSEVKNLGLNPVVPTTSSSSQLVTVSYTHLTLPTNREV